MISWVGVRSVGSLFCKHLCIDHTICSLAFIAFFENREVKVAFLYSRPAFKLAIQESQGTSVDPICSRRAQEADPYSALILLRMKSEANIDDHISSVYDSNYLLSFFKARQLVEAALPQLCPLTPGSSVCSLAFTIKGFVFDQSFVLHLCSKFACKCVWKNAFHFYEGKCFVCLQFDRFPWTF